MPKLLVTVALVTTCACKDPSASMNSSSVTQPSDITSLPIIITSPGVYTLETDLEWPDPYSPAVSIQSSDVTLDLNGHSLSAYTGVYSTATGIMIESQSTRVSVINGTVRGFWSGIYAAKTTSYVTIQNMVFDKNYQLGIYSRAPYSTILDNTVTNTGGSRVTDHSFGFGVQVVAPNCVIRSNTVIDTYGSGDGEGVGMSISSLGLNCIMQNNLISNSRRDADHRTYGIWVGGNPGETVNVLIDTNTVENYTYALAGTSEIYGTFSNNTTTNTECSSLTAKLPNLTLLNNTFDAGVNSKKAGCTDVPEYWLPIANTGSAHGMFRYANLADTLEAKYYWYKQSAALGHTEAQRVATKLLNLFPHLED